MSQKDTSRRYYLKNKEKIKEKSKKYRLDNKIDRSEYNKAWYAKNNNAEYREKKKIRWEELKKDKVAYEKYLKTRKLYRERNSEYLRQYRKLYRLKKEYGLSPEDYSKMIAKTDGKCEICEVVLILDRTNKRVGENICVDHNHTNGKVRGILCVNCNLALGLVKEKKEVLNKMIKYIKKYE